MKYKLEDYPDIKERFDFIFSTISCSQIALQELDALTPESINEKGIFALYTFKIARLSHSYFLVMEICKLLEKGSRKQNYSSVLYLIHMLETSFPEQFEDLIQKNLNLLNEIKSDSIIVNIKKLRDKKYAHVDGCFDPLSLKSLNKSMIIKLRPILESIFEITNAFYIQIFGTTMNMMMDNTTSTPDFLKQVSEVLSKKRSLSVQKIQPTTN